MPDVHMPHLTITGDRATVKGGLADALRESALSLLGSAANSVDYATSDVLGDDGASHFAKLDDARADMRALDALVDQLGCALDGSPVELKAVRSNPALTRVARSALHAQHDRLGEEGGPSSAELRQAADLCERCEAILDQADGNREPVEA